MAVLLPDDEKTVNPNGICPVCPHKDRCKSIRWTERPCEIDAAQRRDGGTLPRASQPEGNIPSPWQRARDAETARAVAAALSAPPSEPADSGTPVSPDSELHEFTSGAKSSEHLLRYDLIPWHIFADRLAKRYTDGAVKYGEFNWQMGLKERAYVLDRANHALRHLHRAVEKMRAQTLGQIDGVGLAYLPDDDDDLAAAMWGIIFLMAAQRGSAEL